MSTFWIGVLIGAVVSLSHILDCYYLRTRRQREKELAQFDEYRRQMDLSMASHARDRIEIVMREMTGTGKEVALLAQAALGLVFQPPASIQQ